MANIKDRLRNAGAASEAKVEVDISYDIIRHVSSQLYTNPRKAIEELITNSYDAGAALCWVGLPKEPGDPLTVLDNGESMDVDGIRDLWRVARSPKIDPGDEDAARIRNERMQIGKFGVGKLAAFALGGRLTHVTCMNGSVRVVSVGQSEIRQRSSGRAPSFDVYKLPLAKARASLDPFFTDLPRPWENGWQSWTLALVEEIDAGKAGRALKPGILKRMIMRALPISAAFKVHLDGELVPRREISPDDIEVKVDIADPSFIKKAEETLQAFWASSRGEQVEDVPKNAYKIKTTKFPSPENVKKRVEGILVPGLGPISGSAILAKNSLTTTKLEERGYFDNGFAIYANAKLVNPEDPLFGVSQRSHAYWTRFLARVEIPGLDRVLLVQRNAVSESSYEASIAREILRALFNFTRGKAEQIEEHEAYRPASFGKRIKTLSPFLSALAVQGLAKGKIAPHALRDLDVDFATLGVDGPAARFDGGTNKILINQDHPLIEAIDDLGPKFKSIRQMIGEVLAGTQMAKGYLESSGVDQTIVGDTNEIIEVAFRTAAKFVRDETEEHIREIEETSLQGGRPFEKAVVTAFRNLRLAARHLGESDEPDGIIEIPISGKPNLKISVEAKGSKGTITHKELSEATVDRHRQEQGCTAAIAIARQFSIDGRSGKESALLRETKGKVPLLTTRGIAELLNLHEKRPFTYDKIEKILTTWTHPDDLVEFITATWREVPDVGLMRTVLEVAHDAIQSDDTNAPDPGMIAGDNRIRARRVTRESIIHIIEAVQLTTGMIVIKNRQNYQFDMLAPVETILEAFQRETIEENGVEESQ